MSCTEDFESNAKKDQAIFAHFVRTLNQMDQTHSFNFKEQRGFKWYLYIWDLKWWSLSLSLYIELLYLTYYIIHIIAYFRLITYAVMWAWKQQQQQ